MIITFGLYNVYITLVKIFVLFSMKIDIDIDIEEQVKKLSEQQSSCEQKEQVKTIVIYM